MKGLTYRVVPHECISLSDVLAESYDLLVDRYDRVAMETLDIANYSVTLGKCSCGK